MGGSELAVDVSSSADEAVAGADDVVVLRIAAAQVGSMGHKAVAQPRQRDVNEQPRHQDIWPLQHISPQSCSPDALLYGATLLIHN